MRQACAAKNPLCPSTAGRSLRHFSKANSLATAREPSRAPIQTRRESSNPPTAARCCYEIGETSLSMQVKLLRTLQERKVRPLGGTADIPVDVRLIAVTNRDLKSMVAAGHFREDFYYRISVIPIHVPPLRERKEDIEPLALHFLHKFARQMGKPVNGIDPLAMERLRKYSWPGNVRELENALERAVALASDQERLIRVDHLPDFSNPGMPLSPAGISLPEEGIDFEARIADMERQYLLEALRAAQGVRTRAAELLRISYRSFRHYAKKYGV